MSGIVTSSAEFDPMTELNWVMTAHAKPDFDVLASFAWESNVDEPTPPLFVVAHTTIPSPASGNTTDLTVKRC
jgi:hypothetical protein